MSPSQRLKATDEFYNEKGERGIADAFFGFENDRYYAVLLAEKHWQTPKGSPRQRRANVTFYGKTVDALAAELTASQWDVPADLVKLCAAVPKKRRSSRSPRTPKGGTK